MRPKPDSENTENTENTENYNVQIRVCFTK